MKTQSVFPRPLAVVLAAALSLSCAGAVAAGGGAGNGKAQVTLNLKDADINTLIQTVSQVTGKNFIVDPRVKGKVTVVSSTPMDAAGVYETFLAVLQVQGFATAKAGEAIKIVPEANAQKEGGTYVSSGAGLARDELVTYVYQPQNASAVQLVNVLRPLVAQGGLLAAYTPANMMIISDRASNVQRIEKLIQQIDTSGDRDIELVTLENATADDVVKVLTTMQQQDRQADPTARPATALADERSNSVLLSGDKGDRDKLKDIIKRLDAPVKEDSYTQVIFLRYANAESLAPILQGYAQQTQKTESTKPSSSSSMFGFGSSSNAAATAAPTPAPTPASSFGGGMGGSGILDRTTIVADKDTNALVISAPPKTMRMVRNVIAQLDIQRAQVLVDAIIAEISANKSSDLGIDWAVYNPHSIAAAGILNQSTLSALQNAATAAASAGTGGISSTQLAGAAASLLGQGVTAAGGMINNGNGTSFGALLKALRSDGDTNILSTPSLTVLDNEEAKISVGQEVPFLTGQFSNTGVSSANGSVNPFQTIDRKDVGLALGLTPTITAGNTITLKIELENSSLSSGAAGAANLITNKRTVSNKVSVEDGQILVLGGLIDDQINDSQNRIPVLGDIPLLGALFRSHSVTKAKRNLMVFIHPVILRARGDGDYYTRLKYQNVREAELGAAKGAVPLVGGGRPLLYNYDDYVKRSNKPEPPTQAPETRTPNSAPGAGTESTPATSTTAPDQTPAAATPAPAAPAPQEAAPAAVDVIPPPADAPKVP
jgi:general secretion pathway protein D